MSDQNANAVSLPPGVTISPGRETVQIMANNQNSQGMIFTLTLQNAGGAQTSVFVPYALMNNADAVSKLFADRVAAIENIANLGS